MLRDQRSSAKPTVVGSLGSDAGRRGDPAEFRRSVAISIPVPQLASIAMWPELFLMEPDALISSADQLLARRRRSGTSGGKGGFFIYVGPILGLVAIIVLSWLVRFGWARRDKIKQYAGNLQHQLQQGPAHHPGPGTPGAHMPGPRPGPGTPGPPLGRPDIPGPPIVGPPIVGPNVAGSAMGALGKPGPTTGGPNAPGSPKGRPQRARLPHGRPCHARCPHGRRRHAGSRHRRSQHPRPAHRRSGDCRTATRVHRSASARTRTRRARPDRSRERPRGRRQTAPPSRHPSGTEPHDPERRTRPHGRQRPPNCGRM